MILRKTRKWEPDKTRRQLQRGEVINSGAIEGNSKKYDVGLINKLTDTRIKQEKYARGDL